MKISRIFNIGVGICFIGFGVCAVLLAVLLKKVEYEHAIFNVKDLGNNIYRAKVDNSRLDEAQREVVTNCNITDPSQLAFEGEDCTYYYSGSSSNNKNSGSSSHSGTVRKDCPTATIKFTCSNEVFIQRILQQTDEVFHKKRKTLYYAFIPLIVAFFIGFGVCGFLSVKFFGSEAEASMGF